MLSEFRRSGFYGAFASGRNQQKCSDTLSTQAIEGLGQERRSGESKTTHWKSEPPGISFTGNSGGDRKQRDKR